MLTIDVAMKAFIGSSVTAVGIWKTSKSFTLRIVVFIY